MPLALHDSEIKLHSELHKNRKKVINIGSSKRENGTNLRLQSRRQQGVLLL
jgi:hypothetical protein